MNYLTKFLLVSPILLSSCILFQNNRTVNITLNPKNSGWYFIKIIRDSTIDDTGVVKVEFNDTNRVSSVRINHIEQTILSPYDKDKNSLSSRLKYLGVKEVSPNTSYFEFYNPTDAELSTIDKWNPTNKRAGQILNEEDRDFDKYCKPK